MKTSNVDKVTGNEHFVSNFVEQILQSCKPLVQEVEVTVGLESDIIMHHVGAGSHTCVNLGVVNRPFPSCTRVHKCSSMCKPLKTCGYYVFDGCMEPTLWIIENVYEN